MNTLHLEYLYDALRHPIGKVIFTNSPPKLAQQLYSIRREMAPQFDDLSFIISPTNPDDQLWIIKRQPELEAPEAPTLDL